MQVTVTISRGRILWQAGRLVAKPGTGRFIRMPLFGALFEGLDRQEQLEAEASAKAYGPTPVRRVDAVKGQGSRQEL